MKRVGGLAIALGLALGACDQTPPPAPEELRTADGRKVTVVSRDRLQVPVAERPVLGRIGDTTCTIPDNEMQLAIDAESCLSLQKDTIKQDPANKEADVRLARLKASFFQPGMKMNDKTVGWALYATRTNCETQEVWIMGNVVYDPEGFEISRATPAGGPLPLPVGLTVANLIAAVCPT